MKKSSALIPVTCAFLFACQPSRQSNVSVHVNSPSPTPVVSPSADLTDKPWRDPNVACQYLSSIGLQTKPYQDYGGQSWCMASLFYAENTPVPNEISYTATGDESQVQQLELSAETYNYLPAEDRRTVEQASEMVQRLLHVALGAGFPRQPVEAFRTGASGSWTHSSARIEIVRDEHSPGRGFRMTLRIK